MTPFRVPFARVLATIAGATLFLLATAVASGHTFGWIQPDVLAALGNGAVFHPPGRHPLAAIVLLLAAVWGADRALANRLGTALYVIAGVLVAPVAPWPWMIHGPAVAGALVLAGFVVTGEGTQRWRLTALKACWRQSTAWERGLAILAIGLAIAAVATEMGELQNVIARKSDFGTFYHAAEAVRFGGDPYMVADGEYFYPPTFAIALIPLTWISIAHACLIWFVLKAALVAVALRLTFTLLEGARLSDRARGGFALGILLVAVRFWMSDLKFGNTNIVILALSLLAIAATEKREDGRAGLWLAIAATIKLVPIVLAGWLLARRRFGALAWLTIWLAVINLAPLAIAPSRTATLWKSYARHGIQDRMGAHLSEPDNQSLRGFLARALPGEPRAVRILWVALALALVVTVILIAATLVLPTLRERSAAASVFLLVGLLISPGSWVVHYTAVLLPLAAALRLLLEPGPRRAFLLAAFVIANLVFTGSALARFTVRVAADRSLFVDAALLLMAALLWELRRIENDPRPRLL
jgi:hypothetical protein